MLFRYNIDWFKKYWYVDAAIVFAAILAIRYWDMSYQIWGLIFLLSGIFTIIANYKDYDILTSSVRYRFWREVNSEWANKWAKRFFYILSTISIIFGFLLIFH